MFNMSDTAEHAIRAARSRAHWGRTATINYCKNKGVPLGLYVRARQLEVMSKAGC